MGNCKPDTEREVPFPSIIHLDWVLAINHVELSWRNRRRIGSLSRLSIYG
jgi:hypothetical protein